MGQEARLNDHPLWTTDPAVRQAYSEDASGLIGLPDAVARPKEEKEIVEIIRACAARKIPVTPQGSRSSTVAGPLAFGGLALSLEGMDRVIDLDLVHRLAIVEPGVNLGEFKRSLAGTGLFYAPDPTSEDESTVGGSIAANASGARSYRYGSTRGHIRALRVVLGDGSVTEVTRSRASKNTAGYFGFQDPVDLLVGSEGTLGIVTRATLDLLPAPPGFLAAMGFFPSLAEALGFALAADESRRAGRLRPRCLELFDEGSLDLIRPVETGIKIPEGTRAAIFFEQEYAGEDDDGGMEDWYGLLEASGAYADATVVAANEERQTELRKLRHAIPAGMNEKGQAARGMGGRKLSTDWAVPLDELPRMIEEASRIVRDTFGGFFIRYGHIGNGHPHFNLLAEDAAALERAREATHRMALLAVERGGTVTAEHGVGKVKREYLKYQYPAWVVEAMRAVKRRLDPAGVLAPGNIFE